MDNYNSISKTPANKFNSIQFFRFISAFMVIIYHSTLYTSQRLKPEFNLYEQGFNGVTLFFVISGFVMIISSEKLMGKPGGWKTFAIKRGIRIIPIYWILTTFKVLTIIFASFAINHVRMDASFILKSYFFIPVKDLHGLYFPFYSVGWTLNFEMFFYLLFTIALALRINPIFFLSIIFIPLSVLSIYKKSHWPDVGFYFNPIVLNFLFGMLAAKMVLKDIKLPQIFAIPVILLCLLCLFLPRTGIIASFFAEYPIFLIIAAFLVVYAGASIENTWGPKISNWLVFIGGASYSLYLIHPTVAPLVPSILKLVNLEWTWLSVVLGIIISIVTGAIFYKFCEKPLTQFFSKLARRWKLI